MDDAPVIDLNQWKLTGDGLVEPTRAELVSEGYSILLEWLGEGPASSSLQEHRDILEVARDRILERRALEPKIYVQ
jgi:hypothetical protein